MKKYWLFKSEPTCYSIDDLKRDRRTAWTGVRNYQARNYMRDHMSEGDPVLFYHSSVAPVSVAGIAKIVTKAHADATARDPKDDHFDPKATKENPIWQAVDIAFVKKFKHPVTLDEIKRNPKLDGIMVTERGSRLSIQPVSEEHFETIVALSEAGNE